MSGERKGVAIPMFDTFTLAELMRLDDIDLDQLDALDDPAAVSSWWAAKRDMWCVEDEAGEG